MKLKDIFNEGTRNIWFGALLIMAFILVSRMDPLEVVMVYAVETMIIGFYHVLKLLIISFYRAKDNSEKLTGVGMTLFFIVHYGIFVLVQTTFFFFFLSMGDDRISSGFGFQNLKTIFQIQGFQIGVLFLTILHGAKFLLSFIMNEKYKEVELSEYFMQPYLRVVIQQFVAIIPGFFILFLNIGMVVAFVLIIIRAFVDSFLYHLSTSDEALDKMAKSLAKDTDSNKEIEDMKILLKTFADG